MAKDINEESMNDELTRNYLDMFHQSEQGATVICPQKKKKKKIHSIFLKQKSKVYGC